MKRALDTQMKYVIHNNRIIIAKGLMLRFVILEYHRIFFAPFDNGATALYTTSVPSMSI